MNKFKTCRFQFSIRLMLTAVFFILAVPLWAVWFYASGVIPDYSYVVFGIPAKTFVFAMTVILPILLLLFVFLTGTWRLTAVLFGSLLLVLFVFSNSIDDPVYMSEKNRSIAFDVNRVLPEGTEVFCNDVSLGTVPFQIKVTDLMEKVPPRTAPPEQRWYFDDKNPIYTCLPWDNFIKERYDQRYVFDPAKGFAEFDSHSKYWWRFDFHGMTAIVFNNGEDLQGSDFSKRMAYRFASQIFYFPALQAHLDLVMKILKDDDFKPSVQWIEHVTKYSEQFVPLFYRSYLQMYSGQDDGILIDDRLAPILDAVARCRYGLSETPTPEECERAVQRIFEENRKRSVFSELYSRLYRTNNHLNSYNVSSSLGTSIYCNNSLVERAVRQMGTASEEPLHKRFRAIFHTSLHHSDSDYKALVYMTGANGSPNLFNELVELYATRKMGFREVMAFRDERTIPLLKTILARIETPYLQQLPSVYNKIPCLVLVDNPLLEPIIQDYLSEWLPKINDGGYVIDNFLHLYISERIKFADIDRDELAQWIESLRIPGRIKSFPLQLLRESKEESIGSRTAQYRMKNGDHFNIEMLRNWLRSNPGKPIDELIGMLQGSEKPYFVSSAKFNFLNDLTDEDYPEAEDLARQLWHVPEDRNSVNIVARNAVLLNFHEDGMAYSPKYLAEAQKLERQDFPIPGTYDTVTRMQGQYLIETDSYWRGTRRALPNFYVSIISELSELNDPKNCIESAIHLQYSENPEAIPILERWSKSENPQLRYTAENSLQRLKLRIYLNENRRRLFDELVSGKITPDEILPGTKPFVWDGKKYGVSNTAD